MMNMQKFRMRDMQKQSTLVRQDNCLDLLQTEAENIRQWQVKMEIRLKEKDTEVSNSKQIIDNLRKSILEAKIENERISMQQQEEVKSRDSCFEKLESTRAMCILVKDEFTRLEESLKMCVEVSAGLREEKEKKNMKIQKLTDDFIELTASMKQAGELFEREHFKMQESTQRQIDAANTEGNEIKTQLQNAMNDSLEKGKTVEEINAKLKESEKHERKLTTARTDLQNTVVSMLETIDKMKKVNEATMQELQFRLDSALEVSDEKTQTIRDLNEQYADVKQSWQGLGQKYVTAMKDGEREIEILAAKLDDLQLEKEGLLKNVEDGTVEKENLEEKVRSLQTEMRQIKLLVEERQKEFQDLQKQIQTTTTEKESLMTEFESQKNANETRLQDKVKECELLSEKLQRQGEDLSDFAKEVEKKSNEIVGDKKTIEAKQQEVDKLQQNEVILIEEIDQFKSQATNAKQLEIDLEKMKEDLTGEAKNTKKISDDCSRWEKKAMDLTKILEENRKKAQEEKGKLKEEIKTKNIEAKSLKKIERECEKFRKECENLKKVENDRENENEELLAQIRDNDKSRDNNDLTWMKKTGELREESEIKEKALRDCRSELHSYREQLRGTEKMLSNEGEKTVQKNDQIKKLTEKLGDLEYALKLKDGEIEKLNKQATKESKMQDCSISPTTFPKRKRSQVPAEAERVKEEPKGDIGTGRRYPTRPLNSLFEDTRDDLLSEVSFGSSVVDAETFSRKRALKSSTPKPTTVPSNIKFRPPCTATTRYRKPKVSNFVQRAQNNAKKSSAAQKNKQIKKEEKDGTLDWFETCSVYAFDE